MRRAAVLAIAALTISLGLTGAGPAAAAADLPTRVNLPNGFAPEGVAIAAGTGTAYAGSLVDGDIYAADLRTGRGRVISQGPGTPSVGLKVDHRGRLYVAGGPAGDGRVIDVRTGAVLASWKFRSASTFINDVILTHDMAWFTDSARPFLYGVHIAADGTPATTFTRLRLTGDWQQVAGQFNANGITTAPGDHDLLVVNSFVGAVYHVDHMSGVAHRVRLGGASLVGGDGMLRQNRTLYVVQGGRTVVAKVHLAANGRSGRMVGAASDPGFDVPTTLDDYADRLYVVNARFGTPVTATTRYWLTAIPRF
ncbi:MAG TPA: hypothetical protein VFJ97_00325 [Dermatophilaceae bacterium]|nr:hypothetical protein [Dermatophilaceae bacterium]